MRYLLLSLLLFAYHITFATDINKDSLLISLQKAKDNNNKKELAKTYKELAKSCYFDDLDYSGAINYGKLAIPLYKELEQNKNLAYIYKILGFAYVDKENYNNGILYLDSSLNLYSNYEKLLPIIQVYTNKGIAYSYIENNDKAINAFRKAVDLSRELGDSSQIATNLLNIGIIYNSSGKYPLAIEHLIQAAEIFEKTNDTITVINTYIEIGDVYQAWDKNDIAFSYYNKAEALKQNIQDKKVLASLYDAMGYTSEKQDSIEKSKSFYYDVLNLSNEIEYKAGVSQAYYRLGNLSLRENDYDEAIYYFNLSLNIEKDIGSVQNIVYMKNLLASVYNDIGLYNKSLQLLRKARKLCIENNFRKTLSENNLMLYHAFKNTGHADSALYYYEKHIELKDSIYGESQEIMMEELREKYESEKKENTILNLSIEKQLQEKQIARQNQLFIALVIVFFLIIIIGFLFYIQQKRKEENRKLKIKQQLFRSQMNPHFIFNALNSIKNFFLNNEKNKAADYLVDFSQLMRQVLEGSIEDLKTLDSELLLVKNYLNLQQLRFNNAFHFEVIIDNKVDAESVLFPTMLLQPFIENSIEHGVSKGGNSITINASRENGLLVVCITDNGPGIFTSEKHKKTGHKSRALQITNDRIKILKKLYKWKVNFEIKEIKDKNNKGTLVKFTLPYKTE